MNGVMKRVGARNAVVGGLSWVCSAMWMCGVAEGQTCHSRVVAETPRAGPSHNCDQILRYDPDGPGPRDAVLVSIGNDAVGQPGGVEWLNVDRNAWEPLGLGVERLTAPTGGVAFGASIEDDGPYLVVVNQTSNTTLAADIRRFVVFDGQSWSYRAGPGAYSASSPGAFDPDGPGSLPRSLVVAWRPAADAPPRVSMLLNEAWTAVGDIERFGFDGITQLLAYDPDGDGPQREVLVASGALEGSMFQTLVYWNGRTWKDLELRDFNVRNLRVIDFDGEGPEPAKLVALGSTRVPGSSYLLHPYICYDGAEWSFDSAPQWTTGANDMFRRSDGSIWLASGGGWSYSSISGFYELVQGQWTLRGRVPAISSSSRWTALTIPQADGSDRLFFRRFRDSSSSSVTGTVKEVTTFNSTTSNLITPTPGRGFDDVITSGFAAADGSVYVSGVFTSVDGKIMARVARRAPDGEWEAMGSPRWLTGPGSLMELGDGRILGVGTRSGQPGGVFVFDGTDWVPFMDLGYTFTASSLRGSANGILTIFNFKPTGANVSRAIVQWRRGQLIGVDDNASQYVGAAVLPNGDLIRVVTPDPTRPETQTGLMRWDGATWSSMGSGDCSISYLTVLPNGAMIGRRYGVDGLFRWSGEQWRPEPISTLYPMSIDWGAARVIAVGEDDFLLFTTISYGFQYGYAPRTSYFTQMARIANGVVTPTFDERFVNVFSSPVPAAFVLPNGNTFVLGSVRSSNGTTAELAYTNFAYFELSPCNFCSPCIADWDGSGVVDAADVAAFFVDYEQGNRCADVDDSAGVDPVDMAIFFTAYEAGGC